MLWRSNKGKDEPDNQTENRITPEIMDNDKERLLEENEDAKRMFEEIRALRQSIAELKGPDQSAPQAAEVTGTAFQPNTSAMPVEVTETAGSEGFFEETEEIRQAKQAIIDQARRDEADKRRKHQEAMLREAQAQQEQQKLLEAQKRAAAVQLEAERKRREADEAEKRAREASIKQIVQGSQTEAEMARIKAQREAFFAEEKEPSFVADSGTVNMEAPEGAESPEDFFKSHEEMHKSLDEEMQKNLAEAKAELAAFQKAQKRADKAAEVHRKKEERARKAAEKEQARKDRRAAAISERQRLERERIEAAELGAGIVNVNGVKVKTELNKSPSFFWRDFFGIKGKQERKAVKTAASEEEQRAIEREVEARREDARLMAEILSKQRQERYLNSSFGKFMNRFKGYCDKHKTALLTVFGAVIIVFVGTAGIFNYCTAYEYSYNGKSLGYVKEKDDVLKITDLVQGALTEDKKVDVVIDAKDDITFKRVPAMGHTDIDTSEDVLKRLSYMGDVNVKAVGIYINGEKVGAVDNKKTAAEVLQDIKDKYSSKEEGVKTEEAVFIENVEVKQSNTSLQDISSEKEMVDTLCTSGKKESVHKVVVGETLADIAKLYSMTEEDILKDNSNIDAKKLDVGTTLVIRQNAPILTVKITYVITHDKVIEHKVDKKDAADIYEGYTQTKQTGKDGLNTVKERITTVNGDPIEAKTLATTIKEEPVTEVILVGTKERPPTVGSGKYIWPIASGYTLTSEFGARWGTVHEGIDLGVSTGTTVVAADGGTVISAGYEGAYGYSVVIDHQNGMKTRYAHNSRLLVSTGDKVFQGQEIALSGNTGRSTGPHLHFEVIVGGEHRDPLNYLP